jgi:hypothetical protein
MEEPEVEGRSNYLCSNASWNFICGCPHISSHDLCFEHFFEFAEDILVDLCYSNGVVDIESEASGIRGKTFFWL